MARPASPRAKTKVTRSQERASASDAPRPTRARVGHKLADSSSIRAAKSQSPKPRAASFAVAKTAFQLATLVTEPPRGPQWVYERKLDGYRAMADLRHKGRVVLMSRNGLPFEQQFPSVARALAAMPSLAGTVVDGEIVAYEGDKISFHAMQVARQSDGGSRLEYMLFDILALSGEDVRELPLVERRALLLSRVPLDGVVRAIGYEVNPDKALAEARSLGDEGIIAKISQAPYRGERSMGWQKIKITTEDDFVVVGWTASKNGPQLIGSLALATRERKGGPLVYAGRVGTGFDLALRRELAFRLDKRRVGSPPLDVPRAAARGVAWTQPRMVVRVAFLSYTPDGVLRHPTFHGERRDIDAANVVRERPVPTASS
jgi:bifunctional non-homologous end joining protein LigD